MGKKIKTLISLCIVLAMLMSQFAILASATNSDDTYPVITAGEIKSVNIENGGDYYYFSFTPETDGIYTFASNSEDDTYGYLYDAEQNELASDDDGGYNNNFSIGYQFEAGKTYIFGCRYYDSSKTGSFDVSLVEFSVVSITAVATKTLIENSNGYDYGDYYYYYLSYCNPEYTVTLKDGTIYTGEAWKIENAIGYYPQINIEQSAENPLGVGKHIAEVSIMGVTGTCEIEIAETPIASITAVATKTLIENYNGYDYGNYFDYYISDCNPEYTVTLKDGTVYTGNQDEIYNAVGYYPQINIEQSAENPLGVGKHIAEVSIAGVKGTCEIEIAENPIASITAVATKTLIENSNGYDDGDYYYYYLSYCNPEYTVTLKDGTVYVGDEYDIKKAIGYYPNINIKQSAENPLGVGKHIAEVSIKGVKGTCEIEIAAILSVTVKSKPLRLNMDKRDEDAIITVTLTNGATYTGTENKIYDQIGYYPSIDWNEDEQKLGTNTGTVTLCGKTYPFNYQVVENPYASLEIVSVEPIMQSSSYSTPDFTYKLIQKDGTVEIRHYGYYYEYDLDYEGTCLPVYVDEIGEWGPGKENKFTVTVAGLTTEASVEIIPKNLDYSYILLDDGNVIITKVHNPSEVITIPEKIDGYTVIGISSLGDTSETKKIILPDSIKFLASDWINDYYNASIEQIVIGEGVQNLDYKMFKYLRALKGIEVSENNPYYTSVNGVVYTKDMSTLVVYPRGGEQNYVIPAKTSNIDILHDVIYDGINISYSENSKDYVVKDGVTYSADMKKIISCSTEKAGSYVMPESVEQINDRAFANCSKLESVSVSKNVTEIVYGAFADCTALKDISVPDSVISIGRLAFGNCTALKDISVPDSVISIGRLAFGNCTSLESITIPDAVTAMPEGSENFPLKNCNSLKTLNVGSGLNSGLERINDYYRLDSLVNINVSEENKVYSSIDGVVYSKDKTEIIKYPYARTATSFTIPDGVKTVSEYAFVDCASLAEIKFPDSLEYADYYNFYDTVWYQENNGFENGVLYAGKCLLKADSGSVSGSYAIRPETKTVANSAFAGCDSLTSITIPDSVTSIGNCAFSDCTSLTSVTIPDSVTSIGGGAFYRCTSLTSVTIPDSVTSIGDSAFYGCPISEIKLPQGLESIGYMAFSNTDIKSIEIPDTVTDMVYGFYDTDISEIKMPDKLVSMESDFDKTPWYDAQPEGPVYLGRMFYKYKGWLADYSDVTVKDGTLGISGNAFLNQKNLTNINLPEGLQEIGSNAFANCISLKSPVLPSTLKTIKSRAFYHCISIDVINIPASVTEIEYGAFTGCFGLKEINVSPDNPVYSSIDGILYNKDGTELLYCPAGKTGTLVLPSQTEKISLGAWQGNSLSAVVISNDNLEGYQYLPSKCWYGNVGTDAYNYAKSCKDIVFIPLNKLTDKETDLTVSEVAPGSIAEGSALNVETVEKTDIKVTYNITLTKNGVTVQLEGSVMLKISVPDTMNSADCKVYRQEADGTYTDMNAVYENGYMVFTTDHFSVYVLTTGNPNGLLGDIDGNGEVDDWDSVLLDRYLAGWDVEVDTSTADIDQNGEVDDWDSVLLARKLAGWDV